MVFRILLLLVFAFLPRLSIAQVIVTSSFDVNAEGWVGSEPREVTWDANGGNPGGYLRFDDATAASTRLNAVLSKKPDDRQIEQSIRLREV